jgi:hypothetical protein
MKTHAADAQAMRCLPPTQAIEEKRDFVLFQLQKVESKSQQVPYQKLRAKARPQKSLHRRHVFNAALITLFSVVGSRPLMSHWAQHKAIADKQSVCWGVCPTPTSTTGWPVT